VKDFITPDIKMLPEGFVTDRGDHGVVDWVKWGTKQIPLDFGLVAIRRLDNLRLEIVKKMDVFSIQCLETTVVFVGMVASRPLWVLSFSQIGLMYLT
jgi:hypothetical protein